MKCKNCGEEINDFSTFCTYCGKPTGSEPNAGSLNSLKEESAPPPGYSEPIPQDDRMPQPRSSFDELPEFSRSQTGYIPNYAEDVKMNGATWAEINRMGYIVGENGQHYGIGWLRFILYFQVFVSAAFAVYNAVNFFRGEDSYGVDYIYLIFPELQGLDITMGIFQVLIAGGLICSRFMITSLRKLGIWLFLGSHSLNLLLSVIFCIALSSITGTPLSEIIDFRSVYSIVVSAVMVGANYVYFKHRMPVFVY